MGVVQTLPAGRRSPHRRAGAPHAPGVEPRPRERESPGPAGWSMNMRSWIRMCPGFAALQQFLLQLDQNLPC
ncbi:butyrophilin subfamily 1 member A1-like [Platysternon megacephalum]|uniref:Butyrophilin subfamily 1 member A1-like n=1 Tax=Platysternon megacephalum TaxID=55544 RepID=A0A4D9DUW0_9SAUR|nr:butyrophilin subfamily 1 member A1-like [Platysternon megacephalum]